MKSRWQARTATAIASAMFATWLIDCSSRTDGAGATDAGSGSDTGTIVEGGGSTAPDSGTDAQDGLAADAGFFVDDFERPDSVDLGNGWTEKRGGSFALSGGAAVRQTTAWDYTDNLVFRPAAEDVADTVVSVDVSLRSDAGSDCAQLHARTQRNTIGTLGSLDGYFVHVCGGGSLRISRQRGTSYVDVVTDAFTPSLTPGDTFRLTLAVSGTNPVLLTGTLERKAEAGAFAVVKTLSFSDADPMRVESAGAVGFSAAIEDQTGEIAYDNFARRSP